MSEQGSSSSSSHGDKPLSVSDITKLLADMDSSFTDIPNGDDIQSPHSPVQTMVEAAENLAQTEYPTVNVQLTKNDLAARDMNAIAYSKSLMEVGDTLVYITRSGGATIFDFTGFPVFDKPSRVHSRNLLATGSKVFRHLLSDWEQHRARKRMGFIGKSVLPVGIEYILDLTPPDEGDAAVELVAELFCSPGICHWYSAEQRCGVHHALVGGRDEVAQPRHSIAETEKNITPDPLPELPAADSAQKIRSETDQDDDADFLQALRRSKEDYDATTRARIPSDTRAKQQFFEVEEIQEYCPIRHRAGIERLLQVIEGKDPRLDSAPKVWTISVLAKYFDCTNTVVDYVLSWMLAEPNCQFIEILPEVSLRMGSGLECAIIARPAFAILVSEEAMNIASRMAGNFDVTKQRTSRFLRIKEDIDENSLDAIQAAGHEFESKVQRIFNDLVDPKMNWLRTLPEYRKLTTFLLHCRQHSMSSAGVTEVLVGYLKEYVRGRILSTLTHQLSNVMVEEATAHRRAESYLKPSNINFQAIYLSLSDRERVMTKFFWHMLRELIWSTNISSSFAVDERHCRAYNQVYGIREIRMKELSASQDAVNCSIILAMANSGYKKGAVMASSTAANNSKFPINSDKENVKTPPGAKDSSYLYSISKEQPGPVHGLERVSVSRFVESMSVEPTVWKRRVANAKANFIRNRWNIPPHPYSSHEEYFDHLAYLDQERDSNENWKVTQAQNKKARFADPESSYVNARDKLPLRPKVSEAADPDEKTLPYKTPQRAIGLEKSTPRESPTSSSDEKNHAASTWLQSTPNKSSSFEDNLRSKLTNRPGNVVPLPFSVETSKRKRDAESDGLKRSLSGSNITSSSASVLEEMATNRDRAASAAFPTRKLDTDPDPINEYATLPTDSNPTVQVQLGSVSGKSSSELLEGIIITSESPWFSIRNFLIEVTMYVRTIATEMLSNSEVDFAVLTDTLLCLGESEYKYLPLWAGGNEDGSGGVYDPDMPPAHLGPNGPGPAYHTGISLASSASTEIDWERTSTVNLSTAANNGYSDHIDRRVVQSDDGFGTSVAFTDDLEEYAPGDFKGKGKAVDNNHTPAYSSAAPSIIEAPPAYANAETRSHPASPTDNSAFTSGDEFEHSNSAFEFSDDDISRLNDMDEWEEDIFSN